MRFIPYYLKHRAPNTPQMGLNRYASGNTVRGVVLKVYLGDDLTNPALIGQPLVKHGVTCDVLVYESNSRTKLFNVPIATGSAGLNDYEVWIPHASTIDVNTALLLDQSITHVPGLTPTKVEDMDGDHVLIQFLGNDLNNPIITKQIPHPRTNRQPSVLDLTQFKYKRYLRGMSFGITNDGNVELDLSTPSDGTVLVGGLEAPNLLGGNLDLTMQAGIYPAASKVTIADAVFSDPKAALLGETFLTDYSSFLIDEATFLGKEATFLAGLTVFNTALLSAADPIVTAAATTFGPIIAAYTADVATFTTSQVTLSGKVTTSLAAGLPYLSSHLAID